ncbi:unnamed protein product [Kuraishia capsulata CBS 1993]|uniref:ENTH domain-containing protein n=1 Tax=Kuraishia capsulata CBS 1993 TaxID=1382522 RepID=W6MRE7_9ASCO|nr:uncharacterized protein KUCA_T00005309001 [Kuraishia capsulata CBS 1993]CDK29321.1 unnamed protein product [Kuraishia capsulata CBS 1993]
MDNLGKTLNNLSLYEVKAYVRKAQNAVLNLSEMEAKVREATNNEPWGASSTLMAEISQGTYNYREREEICAMISRRFTEKSAHEWRQIYKALQLMEYLIKHGSERFVDDARANVNLITLLRSFHYIDSQGNDQGVNVRTRAKQLITLLNDESAIRQERKKARENQKKYGGLSSSSTYTNGYSGGSSSGAGARSSNNRYAAYDEDEDENGFTNRVFGDGGVFGERYEEQRQAPSKEFEEYVVDEEPARRTSKATTQTSTVNATPDLLSDGFGTSTAPAANDDDDDDDEFDDFQAAAPVVSSGNVPSLTSTAPQATPGANPLTPNNLANLFAASSHPAQPQPLPGFSQTAQPQPGYSQPSYQSFASPATPATPATKPKKNDAFSSLLMTAKTKTTSAAKPTTNDDLLGSFSNKQPAATTTTNGTNGTNGNSGNNDFDLLSF